MTHSPIVTTEDGSEPSFATLYMFRYDARDRSHELITAKIFRDGRIALDGTFFDFADVLQRVSDGSIRASPGDDEDLAVVGVGVFKVHVERQIRYDHELRTVLLDTLACLRGEPGSLARCREAIFHFIRSQSPAAFEALKLAYESVPTATRFAVLGDMDLKNRPVERLLYGNDVHKSEAISVLTEWASRSRR